MIGTTAPQKALHVNTTGNGDQVMITSSTSHAGLFIKTPSNSFIPFIRFETDATSPNDFEIGVDTSANFYINPTTATGSTGAAIAVDTNGNVGIGTTAPTKILEIGDSNGGITFDPVAAMPTINTTNSVNITITSSDGSIIIELGQ